MDIRSGVPGDDRPSPIDWATAVRTGQQLAPAGPKVTAGQAAEVVADLRRLSARAELAVRDTTGLGADLPVADAEIVDRPGWVAATAAGMAELTGPITDKLGAQLVGPAQTVTRGVTGAQIGAVLAFLSGRVLGQYDPMVPSASGDPGRLLLVAPNVVKVERELGADPVDFRLWVCLHESTHRLQFTATPWLREHFRGLVAEFAQRSETDPAAVISRAVAAVAARRDRGRPESANWVETLQTPEQREVFDRLMAFMSLLEGHADHVMDAVGPSVVPSVASIRAAFTARRQKTRGPVDRLVRALLGMDLKMSQYVKGAAFVGAVVDQVGMDAFNTVWASPDTLPSRAEIADPGAWVRRVLA